MCLECEIKRIRIDGKMVNRPSMDSEEFLIGTVDESQKCMMNEGLNMIASTEEFIENQNDAVIDTITTDLEVQGINPRSTEPLFYFIQASFVNVRSGPGIGFGITGSLEQGRVIQFQPGAGLDRSPTTWSDGWGWVRADLVQGLPANLIQPSNPLMDFIQVNPRSAVVSSPTLNQRAGAGTHMPVVG